MPRADVAGPKKSAGYLLMVGLGVTAYILMIALNLKRHEARNGERVVDVPHNDRGASSELPHRSPRLQPRPHIWMPEPPGLPRIPEFSRADIEWGRRLVESGYDGHAHRLRGVYAIAAEFDAAVLECDLGSHQVGRMFEGEHWIAEIEYPDEGRGGLPRRPADSAVIENTGLLYAVVPLESPFVDVDLAPIARLRVWLGAIDAAAPGQVRTRRCGDVALLAEYTGVYGTVAAGDDLIRAINCSCCMHYLPFENDHFAFEVPVGIDCDIWYLSPEAQLTTKVIRVRGEVGVDLEVDLGAPMYPLPHLTDEQRAYEADEYRRLRRTELIAMKASELLPPDVAAALDALSDHSGE